MDQSPKVIIYGENNLCIALCYLCELGIVPEYIVSTSPDRVGAEHEGIPFINPDQMYQKYNEQLILILDERNPLQIASELEKHNITNYATYSELDSFGLDNDMVRDEWVKNQLLSLPQGARLLDAGAGECRYKEFCTHLNYVSQDFCQYDGKGEHGLQMGAWNTSSIDIVSDIIDIPEPSSSFDAILCTEVFEHLSSPELAIKEFSRLLTKGGILICTAPFCSLTHFAPYHFSTGFNLYWYNEILTKYGFDILFCEPNGNYFKFLAQELRRLPYTSIRYSSYEITTVEELNIHKVISMLERLDASDNNSSELLCYGYHVVAQKC